MTYCSNCGCKVEGDDLFCPNCGTKINQTSNENQTSNVNLNKERVQETFEHVKSITSQINFTEIINTLKTSALKPISGGKEFVAKAQKNHIIVITIILTLLQGMLGIWKVNQIMGNLQTIFTKFVMSLSSIASSFGQGSSFNFGYSDLKELNEVVQEFKFLIAIPYDKIFIGNCGVYLVGLGVLFIVIYLGMSIFSKVKQTAFTVFSVALISTLPIIIFEIISVLFSYISLYLGLGFIILGVLISIITLAIIVKESLKIQGDICVFIVAVASFAAIVAVAIMFKNLIISDLLRIVSATINSY